MEEIIVHVERIKRSYRKNNAERITFLKRQVETS